MGPPLGQSWGTNGLLPGAQAGLRTPSQVLVCNPTPDPKTFIQRGLERGAWLLSSAEVRLSLLSSRPCSGMELFEEALQKWEQALSVGQRGDSSSTPTPGESLRNPETASEVLSEVSGSLLRLSFPATEKVGGGAERQPASGRQRSTPPSAGP